MYRPRIADEMLRFKLETKGAVLIEGAKWCGKTTTAEQIAQSVLYMGEPDELERRKQVADTNIRLLLEGEKPRLIDEWQIVPKFWDAIRFEVDHRQDLGQYILTGSAVPVSTKQINHTGTGRFAWLKMRPMSLWESGESNGNISLKALFDGETLSCIADKTDIQQLAFLVCRGGWPKAIDMPEQGALSQAFDYVDAVAHNDISRVDEIRRDSTFAKRILRAYARHQGTQASMSMLYEDIRINEENSFNENTISSYLHALRKIFVIEDMPAWNPNLRSKAAIRTSDTHYFVDPSIATAALGLSPKDLVNDLNTFGLLFETMAIRDLRVYADSLGGEVYHYRDNNGLECDAVLHLRNGNYGLIEIKIGGDNAIETGAMNLLKLESKLDTTKMPSPSFKMVLCGLGNYAYQRNDGVYVVPIGCLKP